MALSSGGVRRVVGLVAVHGRRRRQKVIACSGKVVLGYTGFLRVELSNPPTLTAV